MAFILAPLRRKRASSDVSRISVYKNGAAKSAYSLNIRVCQNHLSIMGWVIGDRINIFFDDQDPYLIMLKQTPIQGSVLTNGNKENTQGKTMAGDLKVRWLSFMPYKYGDVITSISHHVKEAALIIQFKQASIGE